MIKIIHENGWVEFQSRELTEAIAFRDKHYPDCEIRCCDSDALLSPAGPTPEPVEPTVYDLTDEFIP